MSFSRMLHLWNASLCLGILLGSSSGGDWFPALFCLPLTLLNVCAFLSVASPVDNRDDR